MKRNGFSLAELLVTLGVIAVISVFLLPAITKVMPDTNKMRILKYYQKIGEVNEYMIGNKSLYYRQSPLGATSADTNPNGTFKTTTQFGCNGLFCTGRPVAGTGYNTAEYEGICKYPNLMKEFLGFTDSNACTATSLSANGTAPDGTFWEIAPVGNDASSGYNITIDIDRSDSGRDCTYDSSTCKDPDRFILFVNSDGDIDPSGCDSLTANYINNMIDADN